MEERVLRFFETAINGGKKTRVLHPNLQAWKPNDP
jgi:hypothetical protein